VNRGIARLAAGAVAGALLVAGCAAGEDPDTRAAEALERATGTAPPGADGVHASTTTTAPPSTAVLIDTTSGDLPDGWPEELAVPEDAQILNATVGEGYMSAEARVEGAELGEVLQAYRATLDDDGWEVLEDTTDDADSPLGRTLTIARSDLVASALFSEAAGATTVLLTITET
jgi:hypothetical protein